VGLIKKCTNMKIFNYNVLNILYTEQNILLHTKKNYKWYTLKNNYHINNNILIRESFNYNVLSKLCTEQNILSHTKPNLHFSKTNPNKQKKMEELFNKIII
jgi:hypothetical protein